MNWIGVITGDIVNSTEILNLGHREKLLDTLYRTVEEMNKIIPLGPVKIEVFRGDSFQIIMHAISTISVSILLRASLISNSTSNMRWDARIGIGIGKGEYIADKIAESDGEAFRLSGQAFDNLGKHSRMAILTSDEDFNKELAVSTAFADDIISNWTVPQASIVYPFMLQPRPQKELAQALGKSPQIINKLLMAAKMEAISKYELRYMEKNRNFTTKL